MNSKEIISSGLLEAYFTSEVTEQEKNEVETALKNDYAVREAFLEIEKTIERIAFLQAEKPSGYVKQSLLNSLVNDDRRVTTHRSTYAVAASFVLAILSLVSSFYFWNQWQNTEQTLLAENMAIASAYTEVSSELNGVREDLQVLINPAFVRIVMNGTENAPDAKAVVYWNPSRREVFLNSATLPALSADEQYQLWALIDGNPVDAGVFDANQLDFQQMKSINTADAFAVTIEPRGGSEAPTLSKLQVLGETS